MRRDIVRRFSNNILNCGRFVISLGHVNDITLNNDQIRNKILSRVEGYRNLHTISKEELVMYT